MKVTRLVLAMLGLSALLALLLFVNRSQSEINPRDVAGTLAGDPEKAADLESKTGSDRWLGPEGDPLPFQSDSEVETFLETADIVSRKRINEGINGIDKILLGKDGVQAHAAFRDVSVQKRNITLADGSFSLIFRDDCKFEVAAYRLSRMLGLDNVPPAIERRIGRRSGTLQLWIEGAFTEKKRIREKRPAPRSSEWRRQVQTMYLFDRLIANDDRNQGNILVDGNWKLWMIDHTRAFRTHKKPTALSIIVQCDRSVWERLQELDMPTVEKAMKGVLTKREVRSLFRRREALIDHVVKRIERLGEDAVLL